MLPSFRTKSLLRKHFGLGDTPILWVTEQACCERAKVHESPVVGVLEANRMRQRVQAYSWCEVGTLN